MQFYYFLSKILFVHVTFKNYFHSFLDYYFPCLKTFHFFKF
jgi:hypothetical protein